MINIQELNSRKTTITIANVALAYCILQVIAVFLIFKQTQYQLTTPLISETVTCDIFAYYVDGGLVMALFLLVMFIAKIFRQNLVVCAVGAIGIIGQQVVLAGIE